MSPRLPLAAALVAALAPTPAASQASRAPAAPGPALSAARTIMAGAPLGVFLSRVPAGAHLAIARPDQPATAAIVVVEAAGPAASLATPGLAGRYELRLTRPGDGGPVVLLRQPLETSAPSATLAAPASVRPGADLPVRGIGPNGWRDRVVIVAPDAPAEAPGPFFHPAENAEATLEAPREPGAYELRYVMDAPVSGPTVLARRPLHIE